MTREMKTCYCNYWCNTTSKSKPLQITILIFFVRVTNNRGEIHIVSYCGY